MDRQNDRPRVVLHERIEGVGDLVTEDGRVAVEHFWLERDKHDPSVGLRFGAVVRDAKTFRLLNVEWKPVSFEGASHEGRPIRISRLVDVRPVTYVTTDTNEVLAQARDVEVGDARAAFHPERQHVYARLSPNPFGLLDYQLVMRRKGGVEIPLSPTASEPFQWDSPWGGGSFSRGRTWHDVDVGAETGRLQLDYPAVHVTIPEGQRSENLTGMLDSLEASLSWFLVVLSFLSRQTVSIHEMSTVAFGAGAQQQCHELVRWLSGSRAATGGREPITWPYRMPADSLRRLTAQLESLPFRDSIALAIDFLNDAVEATQLSHKVLSAFTALETLLNGIAVSEGSADLFSADVYAELEKEVHSVVSVVCKRRGVAKETRAQVYPKIRELQRRPFVDGAISLITRYGVAWADLWKGQQNPELRERLGAAYSRRSELVHSGRLSHPSVAFGDFMRARLLTERLVYRIIGGDSDWMNPSATV